MALTIAQRWRKKVLAQEKLRAGLALENSPGNRGVVQSDLALDVAHLRDLERVDQRVERKRDVLLPKWLPQVEQYIAEGEIYPYPALVYCMVWSFDVGDFERCIDYAEIAIGQGQPMPENFDNSAGAFVADNFRDWVEIEYSKGNSVEPYFSRVFTLITEKWPLHEELTARWYVLAARLALRGPEGKQCAPALLSNLDQLEKASNLLLKAEEVYPKKSGAKTLLNKVTARLRALTRDQ